MVTDDPRCAVIDRQHVSATEKHARGGFAVGVVRDIPGRLGIVMKRASHDGIDEGIIARQIIKHFLLYNGEFCPAINSTSNSALIGHHDDRNLQFIGTANTRSRAWHQARVLGGMQVVCFLENNAIAVKEEGGPQTCALDVIQVLGPDAVVTDDFAIC